MTKQSKIEGVLEESPNYATISLPTPVTKKRVKRPLTADTFMTIGEINYLPSLAIPDQSMSVGEILERFAKGLPVGGNRLPVFDEENDLPDIETLDLAERQEYAEKYAREARELLDKRNKEEAEKQAKKAQEAKEYQDLLKSYKKPSESKPDESINTP